MEGNARERVLRAAERLFARRGFAGTSMRDLAKASGVSQALIHHHFGTKRELYNAVKERAVQQFLSLATSRTPVKVGSHWGSPLAQTELGELWRWLLALFEFFRKNRRLVRLLSWERLEGKARLWPAEKRLLEAFHSLATELQRNGPLRRDLDPLMLIALLQSLVVAWWENRPWVCRLFPRRQQQELDRMFVDHLSKLLSSGIRG